MIEETINPLKLAHIELFKRYIKVLEGNSDKIPKDIKSRINYLSNEAISNPNDLTIDKMARWLGFVQGLLYSCDLLDIDTERDFSRPLFYKAYETMKIDKPKTFDMNS